ncbi:MAG: hypothetical protein AMS24_01145 [Chlamydiae bacterium SM23_39]|nr:MAG: hypothetical protein AMS24_01145 [Chlamydiae bacterium SM23_39]
MKKTIFLVFSFIIVAFGQPVWIRWLGFFSSFLGYALFFKTLFLFKEKKRFIIAFLWFFSVQAVNFSWMTSLNYVGYLFLIIYAMILAGTALQFAIVSKFIKNLSLLKILCLSSLFVIFEWIRIFVLSGFSWNPIGMALSYSNYSLQLASLFGIYGLSFFVFFTNLLTLKIFFIDKIKVKKIFVLILIIIFPFVFGFLNQNLQKINDKKKTLNVVLIQTGLYPSEKEIFAYRYKEFIHPLDQWERILNFLKKRKQKKIDIIVMPEAALPFGAFQSFYLFKDFLKIWEKVFGMIDTSFLPPLEKPLSEKIGKHWKIANSYWVQAISNYFKSEVIIGLDDKDIIKNESYNAAFYFFPFDKKILRYEKQILIPIVEYFPFNWCRKFASRYGISGCFTPGQIDKVLYGRVPLSISICSEETYSDFMRQKRKRGADLFINIANDGWFPNSKLSRQHFEHGRIRAVENGVPIIRACATGVTGGVDCFGISFRKNIYEEKKSKALFIEVPLDSYKTLYSYCGDKLIICISIFLVIIFFIKKLNFNKNIFTDHK